MLIYEKKVDEVKGVYGTASRTTPADTDELLIESEELRYKKWFNDGNGGIKDAEGKEVLVIVDGEIIVPTKDKPEPPVPPVPEPVVPESKENIDAEIALNADYFVANVYNKRGPSIYIDRTNDEDVANHYYVLVASNVTEATPVSVGSMNIDEPFALSIGKSSFVKDVPCYIEEGKLYVAFPILIFEGDVRVGDEVIYTGYDDASASLAITEVRIKGNGGSEASMDADKNVSATMKNRTDYLLYGIENTTAEDVFITKKESDDHYDDGTVKHPISYGFATGDPVGDGYGMGYYPFGWASTPEAWNEKPRTISFDYTLHVVDKGTAKVHSDFTRVDM